MFGSRLSRPKDYIEKFLQSLIWNSALEIKAFTRTQTEITVAVKKDATTSAIKLALISLYIRRCLFVLSCFLASIKIAVTRLLPIKSRKDSCQEFYFAALYLKANFSACFSEIILTVSKDRIIRCCQEVTGYSEENETIYQLITKINCMCTCFTGPRVCHYIMVIWLFSKSKSYVL